MITKAVLCNHHYRRNVVDYLAEKNFKTIIDVGGAMNPWVDTEGEFWHKRKFITAYFDWNCHYLSGKVGPTITLFNGNISNYWEWRQIIEYADKNGKFDFAICTQTLEDIRDPITVCELLPRIAKEGFIDTPSKYLELSRGLDGGTADPAKDAPSWGINDTIYGWIGHRWIVNMIDNVVWFVPKLPLLEVLQGIDHIGPQLVDGGADNPEAPHSNGFLAFWWKDQITYNLVGDDFLGPNPPSVLHMYRECLNKGL